MKLTILSDNRSCDPARFPAEHGLSILLDTGSLRVLLDAGASGLFIRNAQTLGINLADVDYVFLSHGHNDHAGGLSAFLDINDKAKVIMSSKAVGNAFFSIKGDLHSITPSWPLEAMEGRTMYVDSNIGLGDGIYIIADISQTRSVPKANSNLLYVEGGDGLRPDPFRHEIAFYADGLLFTGCAHSGLENILAACQWPVKTVVGGFHLLDSTGECLYETDAELEDLGRRLVKRYPQTEFYTGHCTGDIAYRILKGVMDKQLRSFRAGMQINLYP